MKLKDLLEDVPQQNLTPQQQQQKALTDLIFKYKSANPNLTGDVDPLKLTQWVNQTGDDMQKSLIKTSGNMLKQTIQNNKPAVAAMDTQKELQKGNKTAPFLQQQS